jgi:hypothetical protein
MSLEMLSEAQRKLYDAIMAGKPKLEIMRDLRLTDGTYAAQCTRIRNKGVSLPNMAPTPPPNLGSKQDVLDQAVGSGDAIYDIEAAIKAAQARDEVHGDMKVMHPMAILGVTIQFMRLCGGRFHAHQTIEDVYGAIRTFNADGPSADDVVEAATKPFSKHVPDQERLDEWFDKVEGVKDELKEMLEGATAQTP